MPMPGCAGKQVVVMLPPWMSSTLPWPTGVAARLPAVFNVSGFSAPSARSARLSAVINVSGCFAVSLQAPRAPLQPTLQPPHRTLQGPGGRGATIVLRNKLEASREELQRVRSGNELELQSTWMEVAALKKELGS
jgi:hypothetical protein